MKTAAIICEYNPFHNGHKYQIDTARQITDCDCVVGLMSGNYVQRGDFAIFPKSIRSQVAIAGGMDLTIENPSYCVLRSAEGYAHSAVYTLDALGCVDYLVFGAECDNIDKLYKIADFLVCETREFRNILTQKTSEGIPFATARAYAVRELLGNEADYIIGQPNNLLAIEYIKAIIRLNSNIKPVLVCRKGANHNDTEARGEFASATCIRDYIAKEMDISDYIPDCCREMYNKKTFNYGAADSAVLSALCLRDVSYFKRISGISEGIENKIKREVFNCTEIDALTESVKSKRYAYTRIRRAVMCAYLGIEKEEAELLPQYIKILEFNDTGRQLLNTAKKTAKITLAKNAAPLLKNKTAITQWKKELERDRVYDILYSVCR